MKSCEVYDMVTDKWSAIADCCIARSQAAACRLNENEILLFGGYNKEKGTLDAIEKYSIADNKFELIKLKIP